MDFKTVEELKTIQCRLAVMRDQSIHLQDSETFDTKTRLRMAKAAALLDAAQSLLFGAEYQLQIGLWNKREMNCEQQMTLFSKVHHV